MTCSQMVSRSRYQTLFKMYINALKGIYINTLLSAMCEKQPYQWHFLLYNFAWNFSYPGMCKPTFSSVSQSCLPLCDPINCSTPGFLVHHQLPGLAQTHVHRCHPIISSSVVSFSSCPQSLPASGSFQMSQFFASGGQSIGVSASASVLPMNIQDWFPLG